MTVHHNHFDFIKGKGGAAHRIFHAIKFYLIGGLFFIVAACFALSGIVYREHPGVIADGVRVSNIDLSGMNVQDAEKAIAERADNLRIVYTLNEQKAELNNTTAINGSRIFEIKSGETASIAFNVGRTGSVLMAAYDRIRAGLFGSEIQPSYSLDNDLLEAFIRSDLGAGLKPTVDAHLTLRVAAGGAVDPIVVPEESGEDLDRASLISTSEEKIASLAGGAISIKTVIEAPRFTVNDVRPFASEAAAIAGRAPIVLQANGNTWNVSRALAASWIDAIADDNAPNGLRLGIRRDIASTFLEAKGTVLYTSPKNATFEMQDGRVTKIIPSVDGRKLDVEASIVAIENALFSAEADKKVQLVIIAAEPEIPTEKSNPYGIKEVLGVGSSYFAGSTKNRMHNISVGTSSLNGIIIQPGEVFSTIGSLGPIDGEHGYLQELVIKGDKTTPEYGGGLCQIGSTVFRTALAAGLPITERRNHSYRVSYYEYDGDGSYIGPGKDATIYSPAPDMKFENDTGHPIVLMTQMTGKTLYFTIWGVDDGRSAEQGPISIYNRTEPPEKKLIETEDLAPGVEKCTEKPHPGASTVFTYTVTYPSGEVKKKDFYSHYRPWGEVCLIGKDPNAPAATEVPPGPVTADASGASGE